MLRLRFASDLPSNLGVGESTNVTIWATNENGSIMKLSEPCKLDFSVISDATLTPVTTLKFTCKADSEDAAGKSARKAHSDVTIGLDGTCNFAFTIVSGSAPAKVPCRLSIQAAAPASLLSWSSKSAKSISTGAGSERITIGVMGAASTAFYVDRSSVTDAKDTRLCSQVVSFDAGVTTIHLLEQQMKVLPGFGSICWDAALLFAKYLTAQPDVFKGKRCIDIGSGTGVVAIAAACAGAHVVATDVMDMLPLLDMNLTLNTPAFKKSSGTVFASVLTWGDEEQIKHALDVAGTLARSRSSGASTDSFDYVFASEVAYRTEVFPLLTKTFCMLSGLTFDDSLRVSADEYDRDAYLESLPPATLMDGSSKTIILGARRRACCDIEDFLRMLQLYFDVYKLVTGAAAASITTAKPKDRIAKLHTVLPSSCTAVVASAKHLSKTAFVPHLFLLRAKA